MQPALFSDAELPVAPGGWHPVAYWLGTRACAWRHRSYPGVTVRHCCHPTAIRPYYIDGLPIERKFTNLEMAKQAVMLGRDPFEERRA